MVHSLPLPSVLRLGQRSRSPRLLLLALLVGALLTAALLSASPAWAAKKNSKQAEQPPAESEGTIDHGLTAQSEDDSAWQAVFAETEEVNVVNVEVIVTDRNDQAVTGLKPEDFELRENGKAIDITNFYAVENGQALALVYPGSETGAAEGAQAESAETAEPENLQHHLIVYVDNVNIAESNRERLFNHLRDFLLESWKPENTRVMLASNDRSLTIHQPFTDVPHDLFLALDKMQSERGVGGRFDLERRNLLAAIEDVNAEAGSLLFNSKGEGLTGTINPNDEDNFVLTEEDVAAMIANQARALLPQIRTYAQQRYEDMRASLGVMDQLVHIAAGLPGRKAVVYVSDGLPLRPGAALFDAYARRFEAVASVNSDSSVLGEASRDDATPLFERMIANANASQVAFYPLYGAPAASLSHGSAATGVSAGGNFAGWDDGFAGAEQQESQDSLIMMAEGTGGRAGLTTSTFDAVLEDVLADFRNHYSLGYTADRLPSGKERAVKVRLTPETEKRLGGKVNVRFRSSFRDKTALERAAERTQSALLVDEVENPLEISLETREAQPQEDGHFVVPLMVRVPLGKLVLLPGEKTHQAKVSMFVAVRDDRGRTSEVNRHVCPIRVPNTELLTALGQSGVCGVRLLMRKGPQRIAVSVLDEIAAVGSTTNLLVDVGSPQQAGGVQ